MARFFAILLALLLVPSVSVASLAVKCGDGVVRKACCCKKNQAAKPPCEGPQLRRQVCCELVQHSTAQLSARDHLRVEPLSTPQARWAQAAFELAPRTLALPTSVVVTKTRPPTGPPVYLELRSLLI